MSISYREERFGKNLTQGFSIKGKTISNLNGCNDSNRASFQKNWFTLVNIWRQRSRQRKQLARLDQHLLKDIGLTKEMAAKEIAKPFWK